MKQKFEKFKRFIIKHDEFFVILIFFIILFGTSIYIDTIAGDELWNFQNIYKMYEGYKIYVDANVITTPLFHFIGYIVFKCFGANFFIFRLYAIFINLILIFAVYKIFKALKLPKYFSLFLTFIMFWAKMSIFQVSANYNNMCFAFVLLGILNVINREKYTTNKFIIIQAIISFIILITKQNIGIFYIIGLGIYNLLYEKNKIRNILKGSLILTLLISIFILIMLKYGILDGFISYTILGIKEFGQKNIGSEIYIIKFLGILIIGIIMLYFINKKKLIEKEKIKNINTLSCFAFPLLMISYPIFNVFHIDLASFMMYILIIYTIYILLLDIKPNKTIFNKINICLIIVFSIISITKICLYFNEIKYTYSYDNIYFGAILDENLENKIEKVIKYIKESDEKVIVFSTEAGLYMMPLNRSNGNMDEPLLGNFGKDGENGVIEEISKMENTKIMINKEKNIYQESDKIIQYIKDNMNYIGEIEDLLIYQTKK